MKQNNLSESEPEHKDLELLDLHNPDLPQPKYERLKSYLMAEVTSGRWKPGDALPTEQYLADTLKVARNTVRQAMSELVRNGLIMRIPGKGTFVDDGSAKKALKTNERVGGELAPVVGGVQSAHGLAQFALITPEARTSYYPSLLDGFEDASSKIHHQTLMGNSRNQPDTQARIILQLIDNQVAGVAMVPVDGSRTPPFHIRQLQQRGIPVVFCHRAVEGTRAPLLAIPFYDIGRMAGEAMIRHGHRRVALLQLADSEKNPITPLAKGFCDAIRAGGGDLPDEFVRKLTYHSPDRGIDLIEDEIYAVLEQICRRPDRPTAIMTSFDTLAELLFLQLAQMGLRVPEDISLMGFGGMDRRGAIIKRLSSVTLDGRSVGQKATELLVEMSNGYRSINDTEVITLPLGIAEGRTLGPAPSKVIAER